MKMALPIGSIVSVNDLITDSTPIIMLNSSNSNHSNYSLLTTEVDEYQGIINTFEVISEPSKLKKLVMYSDTSEEETFENLEAKMGDDNITENKIVDLNDSDFSGAETTDNKSDYNPNFSDLNNSNYSSDSLSSSSQKSVVLPPTIYQDSSSSSSSNTDSEDHSLIGKSGRKKKN